jgi:hypothetical protein
MAAKVVTAATVLPARRPGKPGAMAVTVEMAELGATAEPVVVAGRLAPAL